MLDVLTLKRAVFGTLGGPEAKNLLLQGAWFYLGWELRSLQGTVQPKKKGGRANMMVFELSN